MSFLAKRCRWIPVSGAAQIEYEAKKQVYCELRRAVKAADYYGLIQKVGETPSVDEPKIPPKLGGSGHREHGSRRADGVESRLGPEYPHA